MTTGRPRIIAALLFLLCSVPVLAAVPYAGPDADRKAKQALPPAGKALLYLYRGPDKGPAQSPVLQLNKRALAGLAAGTFLYWDVRPGRQNLRVGDGPVLSLTAQSGRIYFIRLTVHADGRAELRQVPYGTGRREVHTARLVRESAPVKPAAAKPAAPPVTRAARSGFNLILKGGSFSLGKKSQNIDADDPATGGTATFRTTFGQAASAFGLEGEWVSDSGWAFGGELATHTHDYTTEPVGTVGQGDMQVITVLFNAKRYFRTAALVQPFVGAGLGLSTARFSGQLKGNTAGFAAQVMGGVAFRWEHVGLYTGLQYQLAETADASASGLALWAGVGVRF
jgi:hypothetical protein